MIFFYIVLEKKLSFKSSFPAFIHFYMIVFFLFEVFAIGHKNRATASTNMNEHSSRSHALLCVTVIGKNSTTGTKTMGKKKIIYSHNN